MLRILFTTDVREAASTCLNAASLASLNDLPDVQIDMFNRRYADYDVVLFMGYDPAVQEARSANPDALIGVVDPRPSVLPDSGGADFIVANGLEMRDWYLQSTPNVHVRYIYPILSDLSKAPASDDVIRIGYHGNKIHLLEMSPRITTALENLAESRQVEFWAVYNIDKVGKWCEGALGPSKVSVRHIQWSEAAYDELAHVDIGIVPNVIPPPRRAYNWGRRYTRAFNADSTDFLLRFKATSNPGRIFVFAQLGIPVVADMFPSALQTITDGVNGFVCHSAAAWGAALAALADSSELRNRLGESLRNSFERFAAPAEQNRRLVAFLQGLSPCRDGHLRCGANRAVTQPGRNGSLAQGMARRLKRLVAGIAWDRDKDRGALG